MTGQAIDFLQTPVFSFDVPFKEFVGGIYIDEFSEIHTKDMLVRKFLKAPIPSAGVGTALSRSLVEGLYEKQKGKVLKEDSLTEDYILGLSSTQEGFKSSFISYYLDHKTKKEFIATREYFPKNFKASARQKSRWITGIVLQGSKFLGWRGSLVEKYFLYRDRKGPLNVAVAFFTMLFTLYLAMKASFFGSNAFFLSHPFLLWASGFSTLGMLVRVIQRVRAVMLTNSKKTLLGVLIRWPIANLLNFYASWLAIYNYLYSNLFGKKIVWIKTKHELPAQIETA